MEARIKSPAITLPGALLSPCSACIAPKQAGIPDVTLQLVALRASQINGCGICVDMHSRELENAGQSTASAATG